MGALLGYVLGRRRGRPDEIWAHQLDVHADELQAIIDGLRDENSRLEAAVEAARGVVPMLRPESVDEEQAVTRLTAALHSVHSSADQLA